MRKKILKVFFVILTGITVTLTGCELSGSNESAQTESESGKDAVKFIPNLTTAVTRKPTPTAVAANPGDSVQKDVYKRQVLEDPDYEQLKKRHLGEYHKYFNRMELSLNDTRENRLAEMMFHYRCV